MTPLELAATVAALGDAVPFGPEIADALREAHEKLDEEVRAREQDQSVLHWAGAELEAYRVSIGLDAHPAGSTGNDHLDWLTEHLT